MFFSILCDPEKLVFENGEITFSNDASKNKIIKFEDLEKEFISQFSRAKGFLLGAISYKITGDNQLAAFMLHQTVEQALNAFITPWTEYRLQTHNLNKLFLYGRRLFQNLYTVFPRNTDFEIQLYQTLHKAYIYGRYKNNFQINNEALQILIERTTALVEMIHIAFYEKIEELKGGKGLFV